MSDRNERESLFAQMLRNMADAPASEVQALGMLMKQWLETEMSDKGSPVDQGAGLSIYDLWVNFGGKELFINIRLSNNELARAEGAINE